MNLRTSLIAFCLSTFAIATAHGDDVAPAPPRDPHRLYLFLPPPSAVSSKPIPPAAAAEADRLFALGKQAAETGDCTTAARLVYDTLHANSDHAAARKLLGYQQHEGNWDTEFSATKRRAGQHWNPKFGWLTLDQVARYENGERLMNGRWISAAEDALLHATIERGWNIDTEHFRLTTNVSLEEGVRLAGRLESLYHVWWQLFARYHTPEAEWKRLFAGGEPRKRMAKRYPVVYFRNKAEYVAALKSREPRIEQTSGIFMNDKDTAYFYADEKANNDAFLYHEVVHELFMLTRPTTLKVGAKGNFWIIEGIACYFESLKLHEDYAELGDLGNARLHAARYRRLVDDFYVPLAELSTYSLQRLQQDERIARLYSQSSGLAWFLLHAEGGRYREATVDYLAAIYAGKDTPATLAERVGRSYDELDAAYLAYLKSLPKPPPAPAAATP